MESQEGYGPLSIGTEVPFFWEDLEVFWYVEQVEPPYKITWEHEYPNDSDLSPVH